MFTIIEKRQYHEIEQKYLVHDEDYYFLQKKKIANFQFAKLLEFFDVKNVIDILIITADFV